MARGSFLQRVLVEAGLVIGLLIVAPLLGTYLSVYGLHGAQSAPVEYLGYAIAILAPGWYGFRIDVRLEGKIGLAVAFMAAALVPCFLIGVRLSCGLYHACL